MSDEYKPENWVLIRLPEPNNNEFKVLAGWRGGYLDGDVWQLNSGITKVEIEENYYLFHGYSGSVYKCRKSAERNSMATATVYSQLIEEGATQATPEEVIETIKTREAIE